jgi:uncharacterized protein YmfQ (DUF2313 family)
MELPSTSCPYCLTVHRSQGFSVTIDESQPLCTSCAEWKALNDYVASENYQAWLTTVPEGMTMKEQIEWVKEHPPPPRESYPITQ